MQSKIGQALTGRVRRVNICVLHSRHKIMRKLIIIASIIAVAAIAIYFGGQTRDSSEPKISGPVLKARFLDHSFGNSSLFTMPDGKIIVVDPAGGRGAEALLKMLQGENVKEIDMIVTNPSREYAKALAGLQKSVLIANVIRPELGRATASWTKWLRDSKWEYVPETALTRGDVLQFTSQVTLEALNPAKDPEPRGVGSDSLVFRVKFKNKSILYLSDIDSKGECGLIASGLDLESSVMVAARNGRYGSNSLELLSMVRPEICVVSTLRNNAPSTSVMDRLDTINTGATLYRSDKDGIIVISTDGHSMTLLDKGGGY